MRYLLDTDWIKRVMTLNPGDFARFREIEVVTPKDVVFASGSEKR